MIWSVATNPLLWWLAAACAAFRLHCAIADDRREIARLTEALAEADAEAGAMCDALDDIAELPEPSRARDIARDVLRLPFSEWPKAVAP